MVFTLCISFGSHAQTLTFPGGQDDGTGIRKSAQMTLSGNTDLIAFKGGTGRGSAVGKSLGIKMGVASEIIFSGGIGSGSISTGSSLVSMSGVKQNFNYSGGIGNGTSSSRSNLLKLEGSSYMSIAFSGGTGRGNTVGVSQQLNLGGITVTPKFTGGIGHGSKSRQSIVLLMNGNPYQFLFNGGSGRGNTQLKSKKISLSGIVSPGFARVSQSAILDFRAIHRNNRIRLNWRAENQEILDHFVVERSNDGIDFNSVGFVSSGSDHNTGVFSFPHSGSGSGTEYFRLLEVFKDSSFSYSSVLKVATSSENESISLYPNPVQDKLNVSLPVSGRPEKIQIFDHAGQLVKEVDVLGRDKVEINTGDLPAGLYWIETGSETTKNRIRFTRL